MIWDLIMIERLRVLKGKIRDPFSLCGFLDKCEREYLVAETIHAAVTNFDKRGAAFSFLGAGATINHGGGPQNGTALYFLTSNGYFDEGEFDGEPIVIPTEKLVLALEEFFAREGCNAS